MMFKSDVAKEAINSRSGKPIPPKVTSSSKKDNNSIIKIKPQYVWEAKILKLLSVLEIQP